MGNNLILYKESHQSKVYLLVYLAYVYDVSDYVVYMYVYDIRGHDIPILTINVNNKMKC